MTSARLTPFWIEAEARESAYLTVFSDKRTLFSQLLWKPRHRGLAGWMRDLEVRLRDALKDGETATTVDYEVAVLPDVPRDSDGRARYPTYDGGWESGWGSLQLPKGM
jgi:hypothetical protein